MGSVGASLATPLADALELARDGKWDAANDVAEDAGPIAEEILNWMALRDGRGSLADYQLFLDEHGDWPGLSQLRRRGERQVGPETTDDDVLRYFGNRHAQTGHGALYLANALRAKGFPDKARSELVLAWRTAAFSRSEQAIFLKNFKSLLEPHHVDRLDNLLWLGRNEEAKRLLPFVSKAHQHWAQARMALRAKKNGVEGLIRKVPQELQETPGFVFDRFFWRAEKGKRAGAEELLQAQSEIPGRLGRPEFWASWRRILARDALRAGDAERAYALASNHQLTSGSQFADLEWFLGYVALTRLDRPLEAIQHFQTFRAGTDSPISMGRAGYWEGRAYEVLGRPLDAEAAYQFGAEFQTGFYGLLAAEAAGVPMDPSIVDSRPQNVTAARPLDRSVLRAAMLLTRAGEERMAARFVSAAAQDLPADQQASIGDLALWLDAPHVAVTVSKLTASQGNVLNRSYFPLARFEGDEIVPPEIVLSIIRRESEFFPAAVSRAGARGLMQLMPGTAREVSNRLNLSYSRSRLIDEPDYNVTLGTAYLAQLIEEFDNNILLVASAYNAGPGRTRSWIRKYGDPREASVDVLDWIENIPFRETRNYVMRVAESVVIYRARLAGETQPLALSYEIKR